TVIIRENVPDGKVNMMRHFAIPTVLLTAICLLVMTGADHSTTLQTGRNPMSSLPERHEVPKEHQWKLEDLFASQSAWDEEYAKVKEHIKELAQYQGKLSD